MKPYSHHHFMRKECIFNYGQSRARRVVENAFGILAKRFQVLLTTMQHKAETCEGLSGASELHEDKVPQDAEPVLGQTRSQW